MSNTNKDIIIDAIMGNSVPYEMTDVLITRGLIKFTGNQWNESFEWCKIALEEKNLDWLIDLYSEVKERNTKSDYTKNI